MNQKSRKGERRKAPKQTKEKQRSKKSEDAKKQELQKKKTPHGTTEQKSNEAPKRKKNNKLTRKKGIYPENPFPVASCLQSAKPSVMSMPGLAPKLTMAREVDSAVRKCGGKPKTWRHLSS